MASSSSAMYSALLAAAAAAAKFGFAALLGSRVPTTGTEEASMDWKGVATKWPASSNHSVKERERCRVWGLPPFGEETVMVRL